MVPQRDVGTVGKFVVQIQRVSRGLGFQVQDPNIISLKDIRLSSYTSGLDEALRGRHNMVNSIKVTHTIIRVVTCCILDYDSYP